ncbi:MAG: peptidase M48 [Candidatus Hydrogenedentes bacterium]|nr:peptidase M48 [Candidatus Hydrogenedentota bacterium]
MLMRHMVGFALVVFSCVMLGTGCITPTGGEQPNMLSTDEEIQIGRKMAEEVEKEEKRLDNPGVQAYVRGMGERIAAQSPRKDVPYEFTVIDNDEVINAFALPGGHMYVYTGLMKMCDNEAQLASVMAHEIAHVAAKHHGETLTRQYRYEALMNLVLGTDRTQAQQVLSQLAGAGFALTFSRAQETEADRLGMDFLFRAGYKPEAMVDFMRKLAQYEAEQGGGQQTSRPILSAVMRLTASHPATTDRITNLDALVQTYPLELRNQSPTYFERYKKNALDVLQ